MVPRLSLGPGVLDCARDLPRGPSLNPGLTFYMLPSMANKVLFNYLILGLTVGRVFLVEVLQSITVSQLRMLSKTTDHALIT